jgi:MFS family permease
VVQKARALNQPTGPWRALAHYNYRLYFAGQVVSQVGTWMQRTAQAWLVLELSDSPLAIGILAMCQFGPSLVLSLVAGVLADRMSKRRLVMMTTAASMVVSVVLAIIALSGLIQLWHVYVLAILLGALNAVEAPTRAALAMELVGRSDLQSAVGLNSSIFNGARILGPAVAGIVIAVSTTGWCFAINAVTYVFAFLALIFLRGDRLFESRRPPRASMLSQVADGVRYAFSKPTLALPLLLLCALGTFGYNFTTLLPLLARYVLDTDASGFGFLNAGLGIGSFVGSLVIAARPRPTLGLLMFGGTGISLSLLGLGLSTWYLLTFLVLAGLGLVAATYSGNTNSLLQFNSSEEYRGRVLSIYTLLMAGTTPVGGTITSLLAEVWDVRTALTIEAAICLAAVIFAIFYVNRSGGQRTWNFRFS